MEERIQRFHELYQNPWFPVMNWVLNELRCPKKDRHMMIDSWVFFDMKEPHFPRKLVKKTPIKKQAWARA